MTKVYSWKPTDSIAALWDTNISWSFWVLSAQFAILDLYQLYDGSLGPNHFSHRTPGIFSICNALIWTGDSSFLFSLGLHSSHQFLQWQARERKRNFANTRDMEYTLKRNGRRGNFATQWCPRFFHLNIQCKTEDPAGKMSVRVVLDNVSLSQFGTAVCSTIFMCCFDGCCKLFLLTWRSVH